MSKVMVFTFTASTMLLSLVAGAVSAEELSLGDVTPPEIHAAVVLQMENYYSGDSVLYFGYLKAAKSGFVLRHAAIEATGQVGDYVEYNMEVGTCTCMGRLMGFMVLEAGLFFKPYDFLKMGFMKGHILRGFTLSGECIEQVPAEKPRYCKQVAPCHPMGAVIEADHDINETMGIKAQFAYLNGISGHTGDGEHDINYGVIFRTPLQGLSISGFYTDWNWEGQISGTQIIKLYEGYRMGFGFNYDAHNIHLRSERFYIKGGGVTDSVKKDAFLAEAAYTFHLKQKKLSYIQPYISFQWWNSFSNANDHYYRLDSTYNPNARVPSELWLYTYSRVDLDPDYAWSHLAFGVSLGLGSNAAKLRIEYEVPLSFPASEYGYALTEDNVASRFLIRLQTGI